MVDYSTSGTDSGNNSTYLKREIRPEETITHAVVRTVSDAAGISELEMPRLSEAIDPEGLNNIFDHSKNDAPEENPIVGFEYQEYQVIVHGVTVEVSHQEA